MRILNHYVEDQTEAESVLSEYDIIDYVSFMNISFEGKDITNKKFYGCYFYKSDMKSLKVSEDTFKECLFDECPDAEITINNGKNQIRLPHVYLAKVINK